MRISAGIFLIIAALTNLVSGCGYTAAGGLVGGVGAVGSAAMEEAAQSGDTQVSEAEQQAANEMASTGGNMALYGMFVMLLGAVEIGAGVVLFLGVGVLFIRITAGVEILSIVIGAAMYTGFSLFAIPGIVGAVLALIAAQTMGQTGDGASAAPG